jgi:hypothetical protein
MDGYAGLNDLYRSGGIREVACMAHVRRKFVDAPRAQGSAIADEAIRWPLLGHWECPVRQWAGDCAAICRKGAHRAALRH